MRCAVIAIVVLMAGCSLSTPEPTAPSTASHPAREQCLHARAQQYSEIDAVDGDARLRAAEALPSCPTYDDADARSEKTWTTTRAAIIAALREDCSTVDDLAAQLEQRAPGHYARVVLWQRDIAACLATRGTRDDNCRVERARRQREALAIPDAAKRGQALQHLPDCAK